MGKTVCLGVYGCVWGHTTLKEQHFDGHCSANKFQRVSLIASVIADINIVETSTSQIIGLEQNRNATIKFKVQVSANWSF